MREEIYELSEKFQKLKYKNFIKFKNEKNFGIKYSFYSQQKRLMLFLLLIMSLNQHRLMFNRVKGIQY